MRIWSWNLTTLLSLLVKRTSSSCGVAGRFGNKTLPFSQHRENCGLLFVEFTDRSLIHIFTLQNPHIVSISPQSHRPRADASSSPNNCNASLQRKGRSCCLARHSLYRWLRRSCADFDMPWADASPSPNNCNASLRKEGCSHYLARRSFCRRLRRSCADYDVPWANASPSLNNCNASLRKEGCSRCLTCRSLRRRLRRSCADSDVPWTDTSPSPNNSSILGRGVSPALFEEGQGYTKINL